MEFSIKHKICSFDQIEIKKLILNQSYIHGFNHEFDFVCFKVNKVNWKFNGKSIDEVYNHTVRKN